MTLIFSIAPTFFVIFYALSLILENLEVEDLKFQKILTFLYASKAYAAALSMLFFLEHIPVISVIYAVVTVNNSIIVGKKIMNGY